MEDEKGTELVTQGGFQAIIEKVALLPDIDVDKLERMMQMQLQWEDRQAEKDFNAAMSRISEKLALIRITKTRTVGYDRDKNDKSKGQIEAFKYTPLEDIDKVVRPILIEEQMTVFYDTEPSAVAGWHTVIAKMLHSGGHSKLAKIPLPLDASGGKNNTQGMGSTFSYGKRYALCALLNIITVGEDDDASGGPITDEQAAEIKNGLQETGLDTAKFLKTLKADNVEAIRTKDYARAMSAIDAKRWRNQLEEKKRLSTKE